MNKQTLKVAAITLAALAGLLVLLQLYQLNMVRQGNILVVSSPSQGDMVYYNGSEWVKLSPGEPGQLLEAGGAESTPRWTTKLPLNPDSGDLLYYDGSEWVKLSPAEPGQVMETGGAGSAPHWKTTLPLNPGYGDNIFYDGANWVSLSSKIPVAIQSVFEKGVHASKYGKNPILTADNISWATHYPEHPQVIKSGETYHMYFHAANQDGYRIGHATSSTPFGTWTVDANPIVDVGDNGTWEDDYVATAYVLETGGTFYMWYSGYDGSGGIKIGLATSDNASGPFTKSESNPIAGFGWVGSVQLVDGVYYMLGGAEDLQDLATATAPEGPWSYDSRPFGPGAPGSWNEIGSMGESALSYSDGLFWMFFGGRNAEPDPPDQYNARPFHIGIALSTDASTWYEYHANPIISPGAVGSYDEFRLSEISAYREGDTWYIYYTSIGDSDTLPVGETLSVSTVRVK